jgi:hypothetical protein
MIKHSLSCRDFLKLTLTGLGATFLAACGRALGLTHTNRFRHPHPDSHRYSRDEYAFYFPKVSIIYTSSESLQLLSHSPF